MPTITWRRWRDPLAPLLDGGPRPGRRPEEDEDDPAFHRARATWGGRRQRRGGGRRLGLGPCAVGPMGLIPLHEDNLPSALFNFWVLDTDFDVTPGFRDAVALVPGVESLDVFTRYRCRLGVGRAFREEAVKAAVEALLLPPEEVPGTPPRPALERLMAAAHPHWAVAHLPGGRCLCLGGATRAEVEGKLAAATAGGQNGRFVTSWGEP